MNELNIPATEKTLGIHCSKGILEFKGCSILSNPDIFFSPLFDWLKEYINDPEKETIINCHFEYIDSASFKNVFKLFKELEDINVDHTVIINWHYDNNDPEILELGELLDNRIRYEINFIPF